MVASNVVGKGPASIPSNEIRTIKTQANKDNLVEDFSLKSVSSDSIRVEWKMPERRTNSLKGYKIIYRNEDKKELPKWVTSFFCLVLGDFYINSNEFNLGFNVLIHSVKHRNSNVLWRTWGLRWWRIQEEDNWRFHDVANSNWRVGRGLALLCSGAVRYWRGGQLGRVHC